ncbi:sialic acid-binding Ig-like lectin 13 [Leucoraja erinacea]|uniref:sialic acid-binding Ig-like lectin 13 n=1 Tax=Leucoraja erinaceus TaxID=7782 RepID=UPI002457E10C|nr:sialic acid-binding Ig-like lectin 13 [Leucoraja erinacea]
MQLLLKLLFLLHAGTQGVPLITNLIQPRLVKVCRGESVTLNCTFSYNGSVNAWLRVSWYRKSPGGADITYNTNNSLCIPHPLWGGFNNCTVSLMIENVSFGHSVYDYICAVKVPNVFPPIYETGQGTRIQVYDLPEMYIRSDTLVAGHESTLTCTGKGLHDKDISFTWTCTSTNITAPTFETDRNGTLVATSHYKIVPRVEDNGTVCSCQINHSVFRRPAVNTIKLNIMYGPQDLLITYRLKAVDTFRLINDSIIFVAADSFLELNCRVDSNPVPTVFWTNATENHNVTLQTGVGFNSSKEWIRFQRKDEGMYWCMAKNDYGWRNRSISINTKRKDYPFLYALVLIPLTAAMILAIIYVCLNCKRQRKDPVNVTIELSPENMHRDANCNKELDTIYAVVRKNGPPISRPYSTEVAFVNEGNSEEEVSYADIVIHSPKQRYNQKAKQICDVMEKNAKKPLPYVYSSSPRHHVDDTSEYSVVRVSRQDLRTV